MQYNSNISYNQSGIFYTGTIHIFIQGISAPIIINGVSVALSKEEDYSNATTIGVISYDLAPSGILVIETTADQVSGISSVETLYIRPIGQATVEVV